MTAMSLLIVWIWMAVSLVALFAARPLRRTMRQMVTEILLGLRYMLWELPLRAITGRWRPDAARIRALEVKCGIRGPLTARERMDDFLLRAGKITVSQYRARQGLPPCPAPVTVDEWRMRGRMTHADVEQAMGEVYVRLSQIASAPSPAHRRERPPH